MTTQQTLSKSQLKALKPCDLEQRLKLFGTKEKLTIKEAFEAGFTVSDICWLMGALKKRVEIVKFADFCKEQAASLAASLAASYASRAAYNATYYASYAASDAASRAAYNAAYYASRAAYCVSLAASNSSRAASYASRAAYNAAYYASRAASDADSRAASCAAQREFLIKLLSEKNKCLNVS